jgi:hypothetical protein
VHQVPTNLHGVPDLLQEHRLDLSQRSERKSYDSVQWALVFQDFDGRSLQPRYCNQSLKASTLANGHLSRKSIDQCSKFNVKRIKGGCGGQLCVFRRAATNAICHEEDANYDPLTADGHQYSIKRLSFLQFLLAARNLQSDKLRTKDKKVSQTLR